MLAHYIQTLGMGQYKRLFEFSVGLLESHYITANDWPVRCIDPLGSRSQDTGGLGLPSRLNGLETWEMQDFDPLSTRLGDIHFTGETRNP